MRVLVIGNARQRRDLTVALGQSPPEIVGTFASLADARRSGVEADALVLARGTEPEPADEIAPEPLTPRELQVLEMVGEGLSNKAIAERLGISDQTVKFHVASIGGKLGAANRTDAVRRAVRQGLLTL